MLEAFALGVLAASSLLLGSLVALHWRIGQRTLGLILSLGAGVLISSVAYELIAEAYATSAGEGGIGVGLMAGALTFFGGDLLIDRAGGAHRKGSDGRQAEGSSLAIVLGTVLDGIPESVVLGVGLLSGSGGSAAMLVAVFTSNLPEAIASTTGLRLAGWSSARVLAMWSAIALASGAAAAGGHALFGDATPAALAFVLAYAGGAVLTMLADTMMPDAFARGGPFAGVATTIGFGIGFALTVLG